MESNNESIYEKEINPFKQAGVALGGATVFMVLGYLVNAIGAIEVGVKFPWTSTGAFILLFSIFNSINSFAAKDVNTYYRNSIFGYIGLVFLGSMIAYFFSQTSINDAGSFRWIYFILTFSYLVFLVLTTFIRGILRVLETEEEKFSRRIDDK
ncbi:MAG: hypothetical protein ACPG19_11115 [Saprospiraceae bacterium]